MSTVVGNCPKCGAPIYSFEGVWMSVTPPPPSYTCCCHMSVTQTRITNGASVEFRLEGRAPSTPKREVLRNQLEVLFAQNGIDKCWHMTIDDLIIEILNEVEDVYGQN